MTREGDIATSEKNDYPISINPIHNAKKLIPFLQRNRYTDGK